MFGNRAPSKSKAAADLRDIALEGVQLIAATSGAMALFSDLEDNSKFPWDYEVVIFDEGSQETEPAILVPLMGSKKIDLIIIAQIRNHISLPDGTVYGSLDLMILGESSP
ncbi:uncharacterized protein BDZ99DRAFT_518903 [Mytilinidion resinicola]|uniref:Uncharacterized protein n=1 Tax=Mytilinidion resinicola TaxID=574789 RepID=A0A6A6YS73_9PEZI|nr:uncharacterized protein BDZ99DRAFT_518903 [Mytilinidion resinicola]KAF2811650.1 hypothetical protein BDZ99DRAFT_518903 [Mytilinidion resinicola]